MGIIFFFFRHNYDLKFSVMVFMGKIKRQTEVLGLSQVRISSLKGVGVGVL